MTPPQAFPSPWMVTMGFGERGQRVWDALHVVRPFNAAERVVLEEMCRSADRLESLHAVLSGDVDTWARIERNYAHGGEIELTLDEGLAEARQLAQTFQRLAASLNLPEAPATTRDGLDDLAARRADRRGA